MRQLTLELGQYPRPIAWTLSEVDRAQGGRDRHSMLLSAVEEVTRYLVLVQLARYTEHWAKWRGDANVELQLINLRRPSFGHYVAALTALDRYLSAADDPYAINASDRRRSPATLHLFNQTGGTAKRISIIAFLAKVVQLRNSKKGHGYTDQAGARVSADDLQPALTELLTHMPLLVGSPLVWVEQIEYIDPRRSVVTLLELMGTQRARRLPRDVEDPGGLRKGFIYMWDGESSPLQLTPFLHLDEDRADEVVYVLAGFDGNPVYQARGASATKHPDRLMTQLEERAPFLLKSTPVVTTARPPDAARYYKTAVEIALADGVVSAAEADRLGKFQYELGIAPGEAAVIHAELGWHDAREPALTAANDAPQATETVPNEDPGKPGPHWGPSAHALLRRVSDRIQPDLDLGAVRASPSEP